MAFRKFNEIGDVLVAFDLEYEVKKNVEVSPKELLIV